jgi:hypothetical protein
MSAKSCNIDPLRSIRSWIEGVLFVAMKWTDGHASGMSPLPLPLPLDTQWPSVVQAYPLPHWPPVTVQTVSHLPSAEQ